MITQRQLDAARQYAWLRAAYFHDEMARSALEDPDVAADSKIVRTGGEAGLESPDAVLGDTVALDVVPDTETSRQAHLGRCGVDEAGQLLPYEPATSEFLAEIFGS